MKKLSPGMSLDLSKKDPHDNESTSPFDNFNLGAIGTYMMFGGIDSAASKEFCEFIVKSNYVFPSTQTLTVLINSPGGSVYDGWGMIDLMQCSRLHIQTVAIGVVASMGAVIFTAGDRGKRVMTKNSYIMTHQFSEELEAKYHEFVAARSHNDELHTRFIKHFTSVSKMTEKQVKDIILGPSDKYLSAKESLRYGLCDMIKDPWS